MEVEGKVGTAYGVYIDIQGSEEDIKKVLSAPADRTVEVAVKFKDIVKEFTMADFLKRLGFEEAGE